MIQLPTSEKYKCKMKSVVVVPNGDPVSSEAATTISIEDEGAGGFITVKQDVEYTGIDNGISIDLDEWPMIRDAIDLMIGQCRKDAD